MVRQIRIDTTLGEPAKSSNCFVFFNMEYDIRILWNLLTAFGIGMLIGIERGWKGRDREEGERVAGIRTFTLTGVLGGITGHIYLQTSEWFLAASFLGFTIVVAVAHFIRSREKDDIGITTQVALLITFLLGAWSSFGFHAYVFGVAVAVVALLGYKPEIHRFVKNIGTEEIYAGIKLLIISVILLPLLPNEGYGPWQALNPYWLWWMVVLITGLSFIGYVGIKHLGERKGVLLTSIAGGMASSTAVTLSMAQMAKKTVVAPVFMTGVLVASLIMLLRVCIEVIIVNSGLMLLLWMPILVMLLATLSGIFWMFKTRSQPVNENSTEIDLQNPFQMKTAIQFAFLLGLILLLSEGMKEWYGDEGIYALSLISGLMDVDAITLSLSRMAMDDLNDKVAVTGIVLAVFSNTLVKGLMFSFLTKFRATLKLLFIMICSGAAGLITIIFI